MSFKTIYNIQSLFMIFEVYLYNQINLTNQLVNSGNHTVIICLFVQIILVLVNKCFRN